MSNSKSPKRKRHTRPIPAQAETETETKLFTDFEQSEESQPTLQVIKHPFSKRYRLAWVPNGGKWFFAGEDTTTYSTREGADTAQRYVLVLVQLNQVLHYQNTQITELHARLTALNEAVLSDTHSPVELPDEEPVNA